MKIIKSKGSVQYSTPSLSRGVKETPDPLAEYPVSIWKMTASYLKKPRKWFWDFVGGIWGFTSLLYTHQRLLLPHLFAVLFINLLFFTLQTLSTLAWMHYYVLFLCPTPTHVIQLLCSIRYRPFNIAFSTISHTFPYLSHPFSRKFLPLHPYTLQKSSRPIL